MSVRLQARLLGGASFRFGELAVEPGSRKGVALLAYLALSEAGVRREVIAETLWERSKLGSVRQALYELRKLPGAGGWLHDAGETVRVEAETDVTIFDLALQRGDAAAALAAYGGDLLAGVPDIDVPAYQDWLSVSRARLAAIRHAPLKGQAARHQAPGLLAEAQAAVTAALRVDPLDEALYRSAMRLAYVQGDAVSARAQFLACVATLERELGAEPAEETRALSRIIERGEPLSLAIDIGALPAGRLRVLQALAVSDGALGVKGVAEMLDRNDLEVAADLEGLERAGLIGAELTVSPPRLAAVTASISHASRRLLHERAATALGAQAGVADAVVARHLLAAHDPKGAAPRFLAAARTAIEKADLEAAIGYLFRACWAADSLPELRLEACLLLEGLASQRADEALQDAALAEAEHLAWEHQSDRQLAEVRMRRSRQHLLKGRVGEGLELALEALEIAVRLADGGLLARARNAVGGAHYYAGDLDGAAEAFSANLGTDEVIERYRAHNNLGSLAAMRGASDEAHAQFDAALTLARASSQKIDVAAALNNLAATAERLGDYARAVKHFREGVDLARRNLAAGREGRLLNNLAIVYARQGQLGPSWNTAAEMEELADELSDPRLALSALELKADIERLCGAFDHARASMSRALAMAQALNDERKSLTLAAQLATIDALNGGSRADAERAIEVVEQGRWADISPWLWLELSLTAAGADEAERYWGRASNGGQRGAHQAAVVDMAAIRAALLTGASEACRAAGAEAAARLTANADAEGSLARLEIAERPLGLLLLAAWGRAATGGVPGELEVPEPVRLEVAEQAAGLPRGLAAKLLEQPERWLGLLRL